MLSFLLHLILHTKLDSKYCFSGTQQREFNPRFQQAHRSSFVPPYHNQMRGFLWRSPQPQGKNFVCIWNSLYQQYNSSVSLCSLCSYACSYPVLAAFSSKPFISSSCVVPLAETNSTRWSGVALLSEVLIYSQCSEKIFHAVFKFSMLGLSWMVFKTVTGLKQVSTAAQKCLFKVLGCKS